MDALTRPFDPERPAHGPLVPFRLAILVPFGGAGLLAVAAGPAGGLSPEGMRGGGGGGVFGGGLGRAPPGPRWPSAPPAEGFSGAPCSCRPRGRWATPSAWARRSGT